MIENLEKFKKEKNNLKVLKANNSDRKHIESKMINHEIVDMADRLENVQNMMKNQSGDQNLVM